MTSRAVRPNDPKFLAKKAAAEERKSKRYLEETIERGVPADEAEKWVARAREVYAGESLTIPVLAAVLREEHERGASAAVLDLAFERRAVAVEWKEKVDRGSRDHREGLTRGLTREIGNRASRSEGAPS